MTQHEDEAINWNLSDLQAAPAWRGAADVVTPERIFGWVFSTERPMTPVEIEVIVLGEVLLTTIARIFRGDIAGHVGMPLKSGVEVDPATALPDAAARVRSRIQASGQSSAPVAQAVSLRVRGTGATLPFSPGVSERPFDLRGLAQRLAPIAETHGGSLDAEREALLATPLPVATGATDVRVVAYYLPQFHPLPENDRWWGTGFTEWTNVTAAKPLFDGHHQPQLPADLGFYDLRIGQVQADQAALARQYGVSGFCYYYYWFGGKTLMTLPIDRHLEEDYDLDFCLCWANESWSRRWDGSETDVLIAQQHNFDSDVRFIESCLKYFRSDRYIKIDGAPLLQVYRISLLANPVETIARWREIVRAAGFPDLHVSMVESFQSGEPHSLGCDSSCQFPPLQQQPARIDADVVALDPGFKGAIFSYDDILRTEIARPPSSWTRFRTAMPSWDNTARRGKAAHIYHGSTPDRFGAWMRHLVDDAERNLPPGRRLVFVNAWNEWAEGAHLEPDRRHGHQWLQALRDALSPAERALAPLRAATATGDPLAQTARHVAALQASNRTLAALIPDRPADRSLPFVPAPADLLELTDSQDGQVEIGLLNGRPVNDAPVHPVAIWQGLHLKGWAIADRNAVRQPMIVLRHRDGGQDYVAMVHDRHPRPDVAEIHGTSSGGADLGFIVDASLLGVAPGMYDLDLISPHRAHPRKAAAIRTGLRLLVG